MKYLLDDVWKADLRAVVDQDAVDNSLGCFERSSERSSGEIADFEGVKTTIDHCQSPTHCCKAGSRTKSTERDATRSNVT